MERRSSMRAYETIFIVHPDLVDEEAKALTERMKGVIENLDGELIKVEEWGRRKLAYKLKKLTRGSYVLIRFKGNGEILAELERNLRLSDGVLKYQSVKLDEKTLETKRPVEEMGPPPEVVSPEVEKSPEQTEPPKEAEPAGEVKPPEEAEPVEEAQPNEEVKPVEEEPPSEEERLQAKEPPAQEKAKQGESEEGEKEGEH
jgi:small subunit ribosomal protein S6